MSRKELTEKDDITSVLERGTDFLVDNGKPIATGAAAVVLIAVALVGWNFYSQSRIDAAQASLARVISAYNDIDAGDESRFNAAIDASAAVGADYPGSPSADIADYYAALAHDGLGNTGESDRILVRLAESGDDAIRENARFALAESYKKRDDLEGAIREYEVLANSEDFPRGAILFELGRLHEAASQLEEARGYYEALVNEYQDSPFRTDADRALRRLRANSSPS
jgi:predicted negative regulator of RcsB-dependent stress response